MSEETPYPEESTIEAWLAGKLPPDEAEEVERLIETGGHGQSDEEGGAIDPVALRAIPDVGEIRKQALDEWTGGTNPTQSQVDVATEGPGDMIGRYRLVEIRPKK